MTATQAAATAVVTAVGPAPEPNKPAPKVLRRLGQALSLPAWLVFRLRNPPDPNASSSELFDEAAYQEKERFIGELLEENRNGSFLEIGVGSVPNLGRHRLMADHGIRYTGCDFEAVTARHRSDLHAAKIPATNIRFVTNLKGTYAWPLFQMMRDGERFDIIYLDGHHTFYVDLPVFVLADQLLKAGGYLLVDDVKWTLSFLKQSMRNSFGGWYFYHRMYDFTQYTPQQQVLPHIGMIAKDLMIDRLGYSKVEARSRGDWWMIRKPAAPSAETQRP